MTGAPAAALPERIGRYRVIDRIAKGAMGSVYSAMDEQLGRQVAVKLMLAAFEEDPDLRERFYREARITGQLSHRNIVTVFDLGEDGGRPFIVMKLLDGKPLNQHLLSDVPPTLDEKLDLMMQVLDGLQNAHQAGVVHREIKPNNLLVLRDGTLKVLDFGVARLASSNLTAAGMLLGTPQYMSPEQARGQNLDARADVFSAAGVFHYMLSGHPPFGARDMRKILHAIINEPPVALSDDEAPEPLRRVLDKGLAKAAGDRYQQCADMRADIEQVRRAIAASAARVMDAGRARYRQLTTLIEERRACGRSLAIAGIDASCDEAMSRIATRFSAFATPDSALLDRAAANAALESLQSLYNAGAKADFALLLKLAPNHALSGQVSPRVVALFEETARDAVTTLMVSVTPATATVQVDGVAIPGPGIVRVSIGDHVISAAQSGYSRATQNITTVAGSPSEVTLTLERVSSVIRVTTTPSDVEVRIDGVVAGKTVAASPSGADALAGVSAPLQWPTFPPVCAPSFSTVPATFL